MTKVRLTAAERGEEVLQAAVRAFGASGYQGTKTDEIARLAGVSQPYVIRLFGTKQELFLASDSYAETQTLYRNIKRAGPDIQISLSDDARVQYENVVGVFTAGVSVGNVGSLVIFYKMPGQTL